MREYSRAPTTLMIAYQQLQFMPIEVLKTCFTGNIKRLQAVNSLLTVSNVTSCQLLSLVSYTQRSYCGVVRQQTRLAISLTLKKQQTDSYSSMLGESRELSQVATRFMKRLHRRETVLPINHHKNQWRHEVSMISKQLRQFQQIFRFFQENKLKPVRIPGVGHTEDICQNEIAVSVF